MGPATQGFHILNVGSIVPRVCAATVYDDRVELIQLPLIGFPAFLCGYAGVSTATTTVRGHVEFQWKFEEASILRLRGKTTNY